MTEIKSTIEMVLKRAEKMAAEALPNDDNKDMMRCGMRLAADFMNQKKIDLTKELATQPKQKQDKIRQGMTHTLLRNIFLPRDERSQELNRLALAGILALGESGAGVQSICQELEQIVEQYNQHKQQMTRQLEDALIAQLKQQVGEGSEAQAYIDPTMHPQYREELDKMMTSLNNQYNEAMDQRKETILHRLGELDHGDG